MVMIWSKGWFCLPAHPNLHDICFVSKKIWNYYSFEQLWICVIMPMYWSYQVPFRVIIKNWGFFCVSETKASKSKYPRSNHSQDGFEQLWICVIMPMYWSYQFHFVSSSKIEVSSVSLKQKHQSLNIPNKPFSRYWEATLSLILFDNSMVKEWCQMQGWLFGWFHLKIKFFGWLIIFNLFFKFIYF